MQSYNDRKVLETAKTQFVYAQFGQSKPLPRNSGKTINWRRYNLFTASTESAGAASNPGQKLVEGEVPTAQLLSQTTVSATVEQYGAYVKITDMLDLTALDAVARDSASLLGEQLGTVLDWVTRDAMLATTSVQYAGGAANANAVASSAVMTIAEIRKAVRTLKKNKARPFTNGRSKHFICIVDPDVAYDLQNDADWKAVRQYQDKEAIYNGELGKMYGVVFVESTEGYAANNTASSPVELHHSLIFGADAYGIVDIEGSRAIKTYTKPAGSSGAADPLNQIATVGAKVMAYAAKVLNPLWIIDIQTAAS
jgi:N4-gp56 family major capsid protein